MSSLGLGEPQPLIRLENLVKHYGKRPVLRDVNLQINRGEVVCVIGPSGSGKSTLLKCVNLLEFPTSGGVWFAGQQINSKKTNLNLIRSQIGMVFQYFNLFANRNLLNNVVMPLRVVKRLSRQKARDVARKQLEEIGLAGFFNHRPKQLSGGQRQRAAIARALALDPQVMLFDEATSALDPELVKGVLEIMRRLAQSGMTMMIVTHEIPFAREIADRVVFMDQGRIVEEASAETLFSHPKTDRLRTFLAEVL